MYLLKSTLLTWLLFHCVLSFAQHADSVHQCRSDRDIFYMIHENVPKSQFWGNSWFLASSYNLSKSHEFELNVGRTLGKSSCGGAGCVFTMRSWGAGYSLATKKGTINHVLKGFYENSIFYFPPISASVRGEYLYDLTNNTHYLRPALGLSLFSIDILYNYSINLTRQENLFKHGVTFRFKLYHKTDNWHKVYPNCC